MSDSPFTDPDGNPVDVQTWTSLHRPEGMGQILAEGYVGTTIVRAMWFGLTVPEVGAHPFGVATATSSTGPWTHRGDANTREDALRLHRHVMATLRSEDT